VASPNRGRSRLLDAVARPKLIKLAQRLPVKSLPIGFAKALFGVRENLSLPTAQSTVQFAPLETASLVPILGKVTLLEGCAMKVLFPNVHTATRRLLRRVGFEVEVGLDQCCGSLHAHQGELSKARNFANSLLENAPKHLPIVVNSAGCGSTMKQYGELLGRPLDHSIFDLSEFLVEHGLGDVLQGSAGIAQVLTYHDACHLAHAQRIREAPRQLLRAIPQASIVEMAEADVCCGSAGVYQQLQPRMARRLLNRKQENMAASGADWVVVANPGCQSWMNSRGNPRPIPVRHLAEILEASFSGMSMLS
jgi:glycolate oxidase iron-sulfur subunit